MSSGTRTTTARSSIDRRCMRALWCSHRLAFTSGYAAHTNENRLGRPEIISATGPRSCVSSCTLHSFLFRPDTRYGPPVMARLWRLFRYFGDAVVGVRDAGRINLQMFRGSLFEGLAGSAGPA